MALGLGRGAIQHRVATGQLHLVHPGVYAVGHTRLSGRGLLIAAVLTCGDGAVVSHRSAASHWGLAPSASGLVDVLTVGDGRQDRPGIRRHWVRALHPHDRAEVDGIPVTSVARTLLDLAEAVRSRQLERAVEEAERLRLFDLRAIEELCSRSHGRHGLKPLRAVLAQVAAPVQETRSELERRFLELCRDAGLPPPAVNVMVEGLEVDALWVRPRLVVELDGYEFHHTRAAFERDRARDARLQLAGYSVLRVTHRMLEREPAAVTARIRGLLAAGR